MITLSASDAEQLVKGNCPNCGGFVDAQTKPTTLVEVTTAGFCKVCEKYYLVDWTKNHPRKFLRGGSYTRVEWNNTLNRLIEAFSKGEI